MQAPREVTAPKLHAFAAAVAGGNTRRDAARIAGYTGDDNNLDKQAARLLAKAEVVAIIERLRQGDMREAIMSRTERKELWSSVARDEAQSIRVRLTASELLAKSEGDFVPRIEESAGVTLVVTVPENGRSR